jgi:hypothetical protein
MQTPSGLMLIGYEEFKASGEWTVGPWVEVPASEFGLSSSAFEQFKSDLRSIAPIRVTKPGAN